MSRRAAEKAISDGKVCVNGAVASLGDKADPDKDRITVDGTVIKGPERKVYVMLNKPCGYVTSLKDEKNRKVVTDLIDIKERLYPVGRLDLQSEGLLILTNDGDFANRMMHPSEEMVKTYEVKVRGDDIHRQVADMKKPIEIDGYTTKPADVQLVERIGNEALLTVSIHEGRNRQIRRLAERSGLTVLRLVRVSEGPLSLGTLKTGCWRYLTQEECTMLR